MKGDDDALDDAALLARRRDRARAMFPRATDRVFDAFYAPAIAPRCSCLDDHDELAPVPALLAAFVADLAAHGATVRRRDPLELRAELAATGDDGSGPFSKRKR